MQSARADSSEPTGLSDQALNEAYSKYIAFNLVHVWLAQRVLLALAGLHIKVHLIFFINTEVKPFCQ